MDHTLAVMPPLTTARPALQAPQQRLMDGPPATRADYVLNQSAQALGGDLLRLLTSGELDTSQLGAVAQALSELAPHGENRRHNLNRAEFVANRLNSIGHASAPLSPGTGFALAQARSDAMYLVQTAQAGAPPLPPPYRNQNIPFVDALIGYVVRCLDPAQGGRANAYDAALLNILANLQCIASNAGGTEMPAPIQAALSDLIGTVRDVIQHRGPGLRMAHTIRQPFASYVHALSTITGGAYGVKNGLLSLHADLGTLAHASHLPSHLPGG